MDPRTGLGRFRQFRISNYELMMELIEHCRTNLIEDILQLPDVKERTELYFEQQPKAAEQIKRCSSVHGKLVVLDLRDEDVIWCTNRFMIYALFPQCNISMHVLWGLKKQNTVFAVGKSILTGPARSISVRSCWPTAGGIWPPEPARCPTSGPRKCCANLCPPCRLSRKTSGVPAFCRNPLFFPRLP